MHFFGGFGQIQQRGVPQPSDGGIQTGTRQGGMQAGLSTGGGIQTGTKTGGLDTGVYGGGGGVQTGYPGSPQASMPGNVMTVPYYPANFVLDRDCATAAMPDTSQRALDPAWQDLVVRVQRALTEIGLATPETGGWDFATRVEWGIFVARYATSLQVKTWEGGSKQVFVDADPTQINCAGLRLLVAVLDGMRSGSATPGDPIADTPKTKVVVAGPLTYEEHDLIWMVSPDSLNALVIALQHATITMGKKDLGGSIHARVDRVSGPVPAGQDAYTKVNAMIAQGYAPLIFTHAILQGPIQLLFAPNPSVIVRNATTDGAQIAADKAGLSSARAGSGLKGLGQDGADSTPLPPDQTGLPPWALVIGQPPSVVDQARVAAGKAKMGGIIPPGGIGPGGGYAPPPGGAPPPPPPTTAGSSWVLPAVAIGGAGLALYFLLGE